MELLLRIDGCAGDQPMLDVGVSLDAQHNVTELVGALSSVVGRPAPFRLHRLRTGDVLDPEDVLGQVGLLSGETLRIVGPAAYSTPHSAPSGVQLSVISGDDGGRSQLLAPGTYVAGRSRTVDIVFTDAQISAEHLQIHITTDQQAWVTAGDSTNPTLLNGRELDVGVHTQVADDDVVQLGATTIALRHREPVEVMDRDRLGHVPFHRTPHEPVSIPARTFQKLGNVPTEPDDRSFSPWTALLPLVAGVMMAVLLQNPRFLIFTAMSPVMAYAGYRRQNSETAKRYVRNVERFTERMATRHREIAESLDAERRARLRRAPDLADLTRRAIEQRADLWIRGREHDDFLSLRVGSGDVRSNVTINADEAGQPELLDHLAEPNDDAAVVRSIPVAIPLAEAGVAALVGPQEITTQVTASMVTQAVTLHSPEDLVVAAAVQPSTGLGEWMKWLPHTRSATSPVEGQHLTFTTDDGDALVRRILSVAERRSTSADRNVDHRWPWVLLLVDKSLELNTPLLTNLLQHCPSAGITVVWLSDDDRRVRREAAAVVDCAPQHQRSTVWTAGDPPHRQAVDLDRLRADIAMDVACALAPLRDASSVAAASGIPSIVPLFDALEVDEVTPAWVAEQWATARGYGLPTPVGMSADGPLTLDLVEHGHGPHGLIAGTSGSGKSELLMSVVGGLVAKTPPNRLNLLFVDYKGGAASDIFADLPHTVGRVTNLNVSMARRALVSLRAELNRRMDVMRGKAKDLEEMLARHPDEAPASLVIILDEFATLVKEIPEFMDGIVDIAQRGRSLGIHLLLSTQRPQGAVNDNILANTNLRICLRMIDGGESNQIIGTSDAAKIPTPLKGRAFARLGPGELAAFQSAFTGAPLPAAAGRPPVLVSSFVAGQPLRFRALDTGSAEAEVAGGTQLDALMTAVKDAAAQLGLADVGSQRRPWRDELPTALPLSQIREDLDQRGEVSRRTPGRHVPLGLLDDPARQSQYPAVVDLEDGGLLVLGTGGAGKTTLLQTVAASIVADDVAAGGGTVTLLGLDFSSGALRSLRTLPQCPLVATMDEMEAVTRMISRLRHEIDVRRRTLTPTETGETAPWTADRVVLLIDGYGSFTEIFESRKQYEWIDLLSRVIADGRQVGVHVVLAADQRQHVRGTLMAVFGNRLVLRLPEDGDYVSVGVPAAVARGAVLPAGRGFLNDGQTIQVAQAGELTPSAVADAPVQMPRLPDAIHLDDPAVGGPALPPDATPPLTPGRMEDHRIVLGLSDVQLQPVAFDLSRFDVMMTGPPGSGRSTGLATIARQTAALGIPVRAFGTVDSPLRKLDGLADGTFGDGAEIVEAMTALIGEVAAAREHFELPQPLLVIVDDIDLLEDTLGHKGLPGELMTTRGVRIVAAAASGMAMGTSLYGSLHRRVRSRIYLQPANADEVRGHFPQLAAKLRPGLDMPVGRGIAVQSAVRMDVVQIADGLAAGG